MLSRILMVSPFPPPYGGIANFAENLVNGLRRRGIHVHCYDSSRWEYLRLRSPGDRRDYWRVLDPRNVFFLLAIVIEWIPYTFTILFRRISLVHVHTASSWAWWRSMAYVVFGHLCGCKTVLHLHNAIDCFYLNDSGPIGRWLIRKSLRVPDRLVVLSDRTQAFLGEITNNHIAVVYNGVETSMFGEEKPDGLPCRLLFVGAVGRQKGVADLLEAVSCSGLGPERLTVTIAGSGDVTDMQRMAASLGLVGQLTFVGRVSNEEKIELFRTHHVFALPSYAEGQPIAILEGMAAGMPVLATKVGSIPEIVTHGENGYLVEPGDIDGLAKGICALAEPAVRQRMTQANRRAAREHHDFSRVLGEILAVYEQVGIRPSGCSRTGAHTLAGDR